MRILHTSDWHLGQHFMGKTRQTEHQALIDWLLAQVTEHQIDAVLIAGDIFDTGAPPSYARELYSSLIVRLHDLDAHLVILAGNHDSVATLAESKTLLARLGTSVVPGVADHLDDQVLVLRQRDGTPGALVCAIPYIRPREVLQSQAGQSADEKQQNLQDAIHQLYRQTYDQAVQTRAALGKALPIVATGHLAVIGASASESVREIYVGSLKAYPADAFPPADYIALGHIHRPQDCGQPHIRYCGSPIPLSFDEAGQAKQMLLVDLDETGLRQITPLAIPCFQPLASVRGNLADLPGVIAKAAVAGSTETPVWLEVVITADDYLSDLQARVEEICAGLPVEVLRLRRERSQNAASLQTSAKETLDELSPDDVFSQRISTETLEEPLQQQLRTRYQQVLAELTGPDA
ncbi:exonuclease subunit SbcD [Silvimonas amylolytica]|uniref:Nuclease SbcCD subunit D n=1 Tax=Silvimonas amylolytica TaxID=449663 RepID=A0ABQ2PHV6_9NEIS|nr:exonuclease subunit SbcD [Silvimonas amylolytica]GGP24810.1 nuclease SbcCD subunit D [Silvimonas amylolytica]